MTIYYGVQKGIVLNSGFSTKNPVTVASNGTVGIAYASNYAWTISNYGTLSFGFGLEDGGLVVNHQAARIASSADGIDISGAGPGTVINAGTISGGTLGKGVVLSNGTIVNASTGLIVGGNNSVRVGQGIGSIFNSGSISGNIVLF